MGATETGWSVLVRGHEWEHSDDREFGILNEGCVHLVGARREGSLAVGPSLRDQRPLDQSPQGHQLGPAAAKIPSADRRRSAGSKPGRDDALLARPRRQFERAGHSPSFRH